MRKHTRHLGLGNNRDAIRREALRQRSTSLTVEIVLSNTYKSTINGRLC
jgi:hypothetical protein